MAYFTVTNSVPNRNAGNISFTSNSNGTPFLGVSLIKVFSNSNSISNLNKPNITRKGTLSEQLTSSNKALESYVNSANSARSKSSFNSYKSLWDNEKKVFDSLYERAENIAKSGKANVTTYDIPNFKDENQWRAGGFLKNQIYAGGLLYNPTHVPAPEEKPTKDDISHMMNGSLFSMLNTGFMEIQQDLHGFDFLDLFREYRDTEVVAYNITVTVTDKDGNTQSSTSTVFEESNGSGSNKFNAPTHNHHQDLTPADWKSILDSKSVNLFSPNLINNFVQISIENMLTGDFFTSPQLSVRDFLASSVINTNLSLVTNKLTAGIAKAFGMKSMVSVGFLNVGLGMLLGELFEMAVGYDNAFGYKGEYNVGFGGYEKQKGFMGIESLAESISFGLGFSDSITVGIEDQLGSLIGSYTSYQDDTVYGQMHGVGFSGHDLQDATSHFNMQDEANFMNANGFSNADMDAFSTDTMTDDWGLGFQGPSLNPNDYIGFGNLSSPQSFTNKHGGFNSFDDAYNSYFGGGGSSSGGDLGYSGTQATNQNAGAMGGLFGGGNNGGYGGNGSYGG